MRSGTWTLIITILAALLSGCAGTPDFDARINRKDRPKGNDRQPPGPQFGYRQLNFLSDSTEYRPVVKIVIVVDNSVSMADEQFYLSEGFRQLMDQLKTKDLNLNIYLYSTTNLGNENQKPVAQEQVLYIYTDGNGNQVITPDPSRKQQQLPVTERRLNQLLPSLTSQGAPLEIRSGMSDQDFDTISSALQNLITNLGTNGSDSELGFCSIARILQETETNMIFEEGDLAAFLVISDSNDPMQDSQCLLYKETDFGTITPETVPQPPLIDTNIRAEALEWRYTVRFRHQDYDRIRIDYDYNSTCTVDGQVEACVKIHRIYPTPQEYGNPPFSTSFTTCTPEMVSLLHQQFPNRDYVNGTCRYYYYQTTQTYSYTDTNYILSNLCATSFVENGTFYTSLEAYMRSYHNLNDYDFLNCTGIGKKMPTYGPVSYERQRSMREDLSPGSMSLSESIFDKSVQLFGEDGFFFSAIVDQDSDEVICSEPTEGYGTSYLNFIESLDDKGATYPICSVDYYPALQSVESFIEQAVNTTYQVQLTTGEQIIGVTRIRNGERADLVSGTDFNIQGNRVRFQEGVLQPGDRIELEIQTPL